MTLVRAELEVVIVRLAVVDDDTRRRRHQLTKGGLRVGPPDVGGDVAHAQRAGTGTAHPTPNRIFQAPFGA